MIKTSKLLLFAVLLLPVSMHAQDVKVQEQTIKKGADKLSGYVVTYKYPSAQAKETLERKIKEANIKRSSHKKGFNIYKGVLWPAISANKQDYYYKITGKKKATLSFIVSKGYDNYVTTQSDSAGAANIIRFLQSLDSQIKTDIQIKAKEAELQALDIQVSDTAKDREKKQAELDALRKQN